MGFLYYVAPMGLNDVHVIDTQGFTLRYQNYVP